jgi:YVTN family beta-propeller protein
MQIILMISSFFITIFITSLVQSVLAQALHDKTLDTLSSSNQQGTLSPEIKTGKQPIFMTRGVDYLYVANYDSGTVSIISIENNTKIKDISVGKWPTHMDFNSNDSYLYVANQGSNTVSVISTENNSRIKDIPVGISPLFIRYNYFGPHGSRYLYVLNENSKDVSVISTKNNTLIKNIPVGEDPISMAFSFSELEKTKSKYLYVANQGNDTVSVISTENNTWIKDIPVGITPFSLISTSSGYLYVANKDNGSVSVISTENNSRIKDIPVGKLPISMDFEFESNKSNGYLYVANQGSNTVSVISTEKNSLIKDIPVGKLPSDINLGGYLYVANRGSNTVSVISTKNNTLIKNIPVGEDPIYLNYDLLTYSLYVANAGSGGISLLDSFSNKVVAGVTFQVNPFNYGTIICDHHLNPPINTYIYVYANTLCTAIPDSGLEFSSWVKNLGHNSTSTIKASYVSTNLYDTFSSLFGGKPENKEAILNITEFGNFTANFRKAPDPIPPQYLVGLYTIVVSSIIGYSIPSIITWYKSRKQSRTVFEYRKRIKTLSVGKNTDKDSQELDSLKNEMDKDYSKGKLSDKQYEYMKSEMKNEISIQNKEIFKNKIHSLEDTTAKHRSDLKSNIIRELDDAYANGNLNELHYDLLMKRVSEIKNNQNPTTT